MAVTLQDYEEAAGPAVIEELRVLASRVRGRSMRHVNSTAVGGGVAEILTRTIPLLRDLGIDAHWDVIKGDQAFYNVTKAFHNALHGKPEQITEEMFEIFRAATEEAAREIMNGDPAIKKGIMHATLFPFKVVFSEAAKRE